MKRKYACNKCNYETENTGHLKAHKRRHTGEKPYRCEQCDKTFSRSSSLKIHKRTHTGEKPYRCEQCDQAFAQVGHLQSHKRTHTGEKPYQCEQCDQAFAQAHQLQSHKRTHTGEKPYPCEQCGQTFAQTGTLQTHKRTHTGEKPHQCEQCGQAFAQIGNLKIHKRNHTGEKPYQCEQCGQTFAQAHQLQSHKRTHTGEKPYLCDHCPKTFSASCNRTVHHKRHEMQKNYKFMCIMQDGGLQICTNGDIQCTIRCKTERDLHYHIQRHHTEEGIAKKFHSETKLAEFFDSNGIKYERDWMNRISFRSCKNIEGGKQSARPDFFLVEKSVELGCIFLVGNDEFAHRQTKCEFQRLYNIMQALQQADGFKDVPIVYVRFNPHFYRIDGKFYDLPLEKAHAILLEKINSITKEHITKSTNLLYVNYDMQDGKLCIFEGDEDDYSQLYRETVIVL